MSAGGSLAVNKASGDWSGLVVPEEDAMDDNAAFADIWGYRCSTGADSWAGYCSISAAGYIPACPVPGRAAVGPDGSTCEVGGYLDDWNYYYSKAHMDDVRANCPVSCDTGYTDADVYIYVDGVLTDSDTLTGAGPLFAEADTQLHVSPHDTFDGLVYDVRLRPPAEWAWEVKAEAQCAPATVASDAIYASFGSPTASPTHTAGIVTHTLALTLT